jgi:hypothetical protein
MSSELNELQNATVGMIVGVIEVLILQPFNYAKNMVQQRQPISMNPAHMYRGVGANCINMGSCTMIQVCAIPVKKCKKATPKRDTRSLCFYSFYLMFLHILHV